MLASVVMDRARAALNDSSAQLFTNAVLLPFINNAWEDLQSEMQVNGLPTLYEVTTALTIPAGAIVVSSSSSPALPTNIIEPKNVYEKAASDTNWIPMTEYNNLLPTVQRNTLGLWQWREDELRLVGSTVERQILIEYTKSLIEISGPSTEIPLNAAKLFLAYKTAAEAASDIGQNGTRASSLLGRAERELQKFIATRVKGQQGVSVRRIPHDRRTRCRSLLPY